MKHVGCAWLWAAMVALLVEGCATTTRYNPFKVSQTEIRSKVKVVALVPMNVPGGLDNEDAIKSKFEEMLAAKLHEGNFRVIPSEEYGAIWKQMTEKLGGFFDPITGKRNEEKFKTVREHTLRELAAKTAADAILASGISIVKANFSMNVASWDGVKQDLTPGGVLTAIFISNSRGSVGALSLVVALADINGIEMYGNAGGLQALSTLSRNRFVEVPRAELLTDEARNRRAVNIALNPLIGKTVEPEAAKASEQPADPSY
jgi:hypothetical protein